MKPIVSVVIAAYQSGSCLRRALTSVQTQTVSNWEMLVVDDASSDTTLDVAKREASNDQRIRVIALPVNGGPAAARNAGIAAAQGEWIAILDADDAWRPERLQHLLAAVENADIVADRLVLHRLDEGRDCGTTWNWIQMATDITLLDLVQRDIPGQRAPIGWAKPMFRRAFLQQHKLRYDNGERYGEDWLLLFEALQHGAAMRMIPYSGYVYSLRQSNPTSTTRSDYAALIFIMQRLTRQYGHTWERRLHRWMAYRSFLFRALPEFGAFVEALKRRNFLVAIRLAAAHPTIGFILWNALKERF